MTTQLQKLEQQENKLQTELVSLQVNREAKFAELSAMPAPTESVALMVAAMDINIKVLQGQVGEAHAVVLEELARLKSPEAKKAQRDLAAAESELRAEQIQIVKMLTTALENSRAMQERSRSLFKLRRIAGQDDDRNRAFDDRLHNWTLKVTGLLDPLKATGGFDEIPASSHKGETK